MSLIDDCLGHNELRCFLLDFSARLNELHWLYSADIFYDSVVDEEKLELISDNKKKCCLILDRNIFSRLINIVTSGNTRQGNLQDIGILMSWALMTGVNLFPQLALNEGAASNSNIQYEYEIFKQVYDEEYYLEWFAIARGLKDDFSPLINPQSSTLVSAVDSIDFYVNYAAMLRLVVVLRTETDIFERFKKYFDWLYHHLPVSRFTEVYVTRVLLGEEGFNQPKKTMSNDFEKVRHGCENQARDLSYITSASIEAWPFGKYEPILVTDDVMLGKIFQIGQYEFNAIEYFERVVKRNSRRAADWILELKAKHEPFVHPHIQEYCEGLIEEQLNILNNIISNN